MPFVRSMPTKDMGPTKHECAREVDENFTIIKSLGEGKYAQVKEVQEKGLSGRRFAWKQIRTKSSRGNEEVRLLQRLQHQNIVHIHDVYSRGSVMDIVLELCQSDMRTYMNSKVERYGPAKVYHAPSPEELGSTVQQVLLAVQFLHEKLIAHRDINPSNVLLSLRQQWKLADFNLACEFNPNLPMTDTVGTQPYAAPEVYQKSYTAKCDVYSLGVLFIALVMGPIGGDGLREVPESLLEESAWYRKCGQGGLAFAQAMIVPEPERCDASSALENPWLLQQFVLSKGCCVVS